jgi:hypothetical protein
MSEWRRATADSSRRAGFPPLPSGQPWEMTEFTSQQTGTGGGGGGGGVKDAAQERAQQVAGQAQQAAGQAKSTLRDQVDQRSTDAGGRVNSTAQDVRSVGEELRKQGKDGPAKIADQAAERAERVGGYLENASGDKILHDIEDAARSNPWAVALGGLALGFAASRLLKASSSERYSSRYSGSGNGSEYRGRYSGTGPQLPAPPAGPASGDTRRGSGLATSPVPGGNVPPVGAPVPAPPVPSPTGGGL